MKVIDPGHIYHLDMLDGQGTTPLTFVKRMGEGYPGNNSKYPGTNLQEVLRACIDRLKYVNNQVHDNQNIEAIQHLRDTIWLLENRAAVRHKRKLKWTLQVPLDEYPTCKKCGHINPETHNHNEST